MAFYVGNIRISDLLLVTLPNEIEQNNSTASNSSSNQVDEEETE